MISDSLFCDDKAILNLYGILASGEETFYIALSNTDIAFKCTLKQLINGNFQVEFDIPQNAEDRINVDDFYAVPSVLAIPKPSNRKGLPDFNIIITPSDVETVTANYFADDENKPTHVSVETLFDEDDRVVAKHTILFRYNPKFFHQLIKVSFTT